MSVPGNPLCSFPRHTKSWNPDKVCPTANVSCACGAYEKDTKNASSSETSASWSIFEYRHDSFCSFFIEKTLLFRQQRPRVHFHELLRRASFKKRLSENRFSLLLWFLLRKEHILQNSQELLRCIQTLPHRYGAFQRNGSVTNDRHCLSEGTIARITAAGFEGVRIWLHRSFPKRLPQKIRKIPVSSSDILPFKKRASLPRKKKPSKVLHLLGITLGKKEQ